MQCCIVSCGAYCVVVYASVSCPLLALQNLVHYGVILYRIILCVCLRVLLCSACVCVFAWGGCQWWWGGARVKSQPLQIFSAVIFLPETFGLFFLGWWKGLGFCFVSFARLACLWCMCFCVALLTYCVVVYGSVSRPLLWVCMWSWSLRCVRVMVWVWFHAV